MAEGNKSWGQDFLSKVLDFFKKNKRMFDSISLIRVLFWFWTWKIIAFLIWICSVYYIAANWKDIIKFKD